MSALLGKAGKNLFEKHIEKYTPADPLYEFYTNDKGKQKRRKRALPPGLSARDARILRTLKSRAHYLDKGFSFCGLRFGWTFLIGLIPVVGDLADVTLNYFLVVGPARKADIPPWLLRRMLMNNAVSAGVGFVPVVGDVILAAFKANSRNVALLEEFLRIRGEEFIKMGGNVDGEDGEGQKKGWWNIGNGKGKKRAIIKDGDLSKADQEQVKPGAGMTALELKNSLPGLPPDAKNAKPKNRATSAAAPADTDLAPVSKSHSKSKKRKGSPDSGSGSSGFSFFGRGKKQTTPEEDKLATDKGRFVEGAMDSTDGIPGGLK